MLVDLHLSFYAVEDLAARNHLENNNGNIIKQLHSCPDQLIMFIMVLKGLLGWDWEQSSLVLNTQPKKHGIILQVA